MAQENEIDRAAKAVRRRWRNDEDPAIWQREFTTYDIASICGVSPRTVCMWCQRGLLRYNRLPDTPDQKGHRRILREDLIAFMRQHGIPSLRPDVLTVGSGD